MNSSRLAWLMVCSVDGHLASVSSGQRPPGHMVVRLGAWYT